MSFLLKDQVYEKLLGLLNEGKLEPGKTYSLNALAADLNMSRTPVRDAIMKLADERRLDLLPSRGVRLHQMTEEEMHQHYHFSTAIEGYCAACLAKAYEENPNNIYVRQMEKDLEGMAELAGKKETSLHFSPWIRTFTESCWNRWRTITFVACSILLWVFSATQNCSVLRKSFPENPSVNVMRIS